MAHQDVIFPHASSGELPIVRSIGFADLVDALKKGLDDFRAMPTHVIFICLLYPIVGLALGRVTFGYNIIPLFYPLAAGFALVGPIAAIGLYELSRRRELGLDTSWSHAFDVIYSPSFGAIVALGLVLMIIFGVWIAVAHAIYIANFGYQEPNSLIGFASDVLTTPHGHNLIIVGNLVGFVFAVISMALSVVSFPLLLDRNVGVTAAALTSVRAVIKNPITMAAWGLIVATLLLIGSLPLFFGLAIVMPILGHSTWHLYGKLVEADEHERLEYQPRARRERYAADFPAALFPWGRKQR
jgi:uncharacterized membrane protein